MTAKNIVWVGGEHAFKLTVPLLRALQEKADCGPEWLLRRLLSPQWRVDDVIELTRLALIGGGMDADKARKLVLDHLEEKPENLKPTAVVVGMVLLDSILVEGAGEPDQGEAVAAAKEV